LASLYSTINMMHGPVNITFTLFSSLYRAIEQDTKVIRPTICTRVSDSN